MSNITLCCDAAKTINDTRQSKLRCSNGPDAS
jgi:hypothetical protein